MSKYVQDNEWGTKYPNFKKSEFVCPCCGSVGVGIASSLVANLQTLRNQGGAIKISSGYRCKKYNSTLKGASADSWHLLGQAADWYYENGSMGNQSKRIALVNQIKTMPNYHWSYCNVNDNYPNMGSAIHMDFYLTNDDPNTKSVDELAQEVIAGKWGNYPERKTRLENAGYNYSEVQRRVNELVSGNTKKYIQINATAGVWCRTRTYGFNAPKYKVIPYQTKCELLAKNIGNANGYNWDKIIYDGIEVYIPNKWNVYL